MFENVSGDPTFNRGTVKYGSLQEKQAILVNIVKSSHPNSFGLDREFLRTRGRYVTSDLHCSHFY